MSGKKRRPRKWSSRQALAAEPTTSVGAKKKTKTEVAAARPASGGPWFPIHESDAHDARGFCSLQGIMEGRKKRQVERVADGTFGNCYNCNEPSHIARECPAPRAEGGRGGGRGAGRGGARGGRGRGRGKRERPARGRDNAQDDEGVEDEEN